MKRYVMEPGKPGKLVADVKPAPTREQMLRTFGLAPVLPHACCALATPRPCACVYSYSCPTHGNTCIGSHD